jgi:hypothetical protein
MIPCVYADFNDMLGPNSIALICRGSVEDISKQNIILEEGMKLSVSDGELFATGTVGKTKDGEGWPGAGMWMVEFNEEGVRDLPENPQPN